jgi:uncharacterized protein
VRALTNREVIKLNIENNEAAHRWEAHYGQHLAVAEYRRLSGTLFFIHTEVPPELEGQGIASRLVQAALDDARTKHLAVVPFCPYVASYIRRHPEYEPLVHVDYRYLISGEPPQSFYLEGTDGQTSNLPGIVSTAEETAAGVDARS